MTEPDAPAAAEALVALAGPSQPADPPPALELLQPALSAILRESDWDTLTYRSIRTELRRMLGKAAVPDAWLRPAVNHAMWARKTEEAVERELVADRSLSVRELRGASSGCARRAGRRGARAAPRRCPACRGQRPQPGRARRRRRSWPPASRTSTPTCCRAAAGCRDRGLRPPVAVAALPEPAAAADGGAVVVRRQRRGISAATRVPAPKRATAAEILIHDALESQPRRRATLAKSSAAR